MTTQETDHLTFDDQQWDIVEWVGDAHAAVPTNEATGISTQMESTANVRGRVDGFVVGGDDRLRLASMRVTPADGAGGSVPAGARAEPITEGPFAGQSVRFTFDDHPVPVTGEMLIARDASGPPAPGQPAIEVYASARLVRFEAGLLVEHADHPINTEGDANGGFV